MKSFEISLIFTGAKSSDSLLNKKLVDMYCKHVIKKNNMTEQEKWLLKASLLVGICDIMLRIILTKYII